MKVYLSNYRHHWFSPYTMIDNLFFWTEWSKCRRDNGLARAMSLGLSGLRRPRYSMNRFMPTRTISISLALTPHFAKCAGQVATTF